MLNKLLTLLSSRERKRAYLLLGMIIVMALLDVMGVASIMPFMSVLANPQVVETNQYLYTMYAYLEFKSTERFLFFLGIMAFVALIVSIGFKAITTYALLRFTHMRNYSLSKSLVKQYLEQDYEWFLNRHSADIGKVILSEVQQVVNSALIPFMQLLAHSSVALALLILLILVDTKLAFVVAVVLGGVYALIYLLLRRYIGNIGQDRLQANRERFETVQEAFGGIKDVKFSGMENVMLARFDDPAKRFSSHQAASAAASQLPRFALEILAFGGMIAVALYLMAGAGGLQNALPVLSVYAFAGYRLMPALQQIYAQLSKMRFAGPALEALHNDIKSLSSKSNNDLSKPLSEPLHMHVGIQLYKVDYSYPKASSLALNKLTFEIPARATVGIVGSTGSGKSTTVDLILGLLSPKEGKLFVDGKQITHQNRRNWQKSIGYVPQHIYLIDDSVAANIAFGLSPQQIDLVAIERAARIANIHDFVINEMPDGYNTMVGERGIRLSGGQRQRIGIARALYHDPDVLILDEATSALDNLTEQAIIEAVHNLGCSKTIIMIAHRLTTLRECSRIYVLERGSLVGQGTYNELVNNNLNFRAMTEYE